MDGNFVSQHSGYTYKLRGGPFSEPLCFFKATSQEHLDECIAKKHFVMPFNPNYGSKDLTYEDMLKNKHTDLNFTLTDSSDPDTFRKCPHFKRVEDMVNNHNGLICDALLAAGGPLFKRGDNGDKKALMQKFKNIIRPTPAEDEDFVEGQKGPDGKVKKRNPPRIGFRVTNFTKPPLNGKFFTGIGGERPHGEYDKGAFAGIHRENDFGFFEPKCVVDKLGQGMAAGKVEVTCNYVWVKVNMQKQVIEIVPSYQLSTLYMYKPKGGGSSAPQDPDCIYVEGPASDDDDDNASRGGATMRREEDGEDRSDRSISQGDANPNEPAAKRARLD